MAKVASSKVSQASTEGQEQVKAQTLVNQDPSLAGVTIDQGQATEVNLPSPTGASIKGQGFLAFIGYRQDSKGTIYIQDFTFHNSEVYIYQGDIASFKAYQFQEQTFLVLEYRESNKRDYSHLRGTSKEEAIALYLSPKGEEYRGKVNKAKALPKPPKGTVRADYLKSL